MILYIFIVSINQNSELKQNLSVLRGKVEVNISDYCVKTKITLKCDGNITYILKNKEIILIIKQ